MTPSPPRHLQVLCLVLVAASACAGDDDAPFALAFAAVADGREVGCSDAVTGLGPGGASAVRLNDLRLYVSNLRFSDSAGREVPLELDDNEFQYNGPEGAVALIDFTGNTVGSCAGDALGAAEGTARVNQAITGHTRVADVAAVSFDVGVPQGLMKQMIASHTPEGTPSPLSEMYWSWNSGYRHVVLNFTVTHGDESGGGYVHIGSRDCGPTGGKALEDRDRCTYLNTPRVALADFDVESDTVGVDLRAILAGVDFVAPIYDENFEVIGEGPGVECHSAPTQPDCATLFGNFGVDLPSGDATAAANHVFVKR